MQAVSCYRSAGSLPIPTPAKPVVKKWIKLNKYKEDVEEITDQARQEAKMETKVQGQVPIAM